MFHHRSISIILASSLVLHLQFFLTPAGAEEGEIDFAHDVMPLLKTQCAKCHTNGTYKGSVSMDSRQELLKSEAVIFGNSDESELIRRVTSADPDERMPPKSDPLPEKQIALLKKWIDAGLPWPDELSLKKAKFVAPLKITKPELPKSQSGKTHPIDLFVEQYFALQGVDPPGKLSDAMYLRRLKLDLLGLLPDAGELQRFLNDKDANKYQSVAREFLGRDREYADHWLTFWNDLLRNDYVGTGYIDGGRTQITAWLYDSLLQNKPYDQFVRELINPQPDAAGFIKGIQWRGRVNASQITQLQFSQNISQVFLGINMKCASCHDSFIDDWKLHDAYGLAAIISDAPLEINRCDKPTGEIAKSKFVFPELGEINGELPPAQRLQRLAELMTSPDNGRFARTIVNRIWQRLLGRGIVHPVDVMGNEPWSPELLDYLAAELIENNFDLKKIIDLIVTSDIYRSQSVSTEEIEAGDSFVFRGVQTKRMTAEQFIDAIWKITSTAPAKADAPINPVSSAGNAKLSANWVWHSQVASKGVPAGDRITLRWQFDSDRDWKRAVAVADCDNQYTLYLNGKRLAKSEDWNQILTIDLSPALQKGENEILVDAVNLGEQPNPAGFIFAGQLVGADGESKSIISDANWQWTRAALNEQGKFANEVKDWQAAAEVENQNFLGDVLRAKLAGQIAGLDSETVAPVTLVRASLVQADALMRSLGRPNREQVVTTRPEQLSTLQALDLSNGQILMDMLDRGAKQVLQAYQQATAEQMVDAIFADALARKPNAAELKLAEQFFAEGKTNEAVADFLWTVFMLPEFQLIR